MIKYTKEMMELSKQYMGYGTTTPKWRFWLGVPRAFSKLYWYAIQDWILRKWYQWKY
jgi:hypothetical protein